jgi:magnesium transporter
VLWGTLIGSMLPILLRRFGLDPASASAPLVATLSDVTGIVVYFSAVSWFLSHVLPPVA